MDQYLIPSTESYIFSKKDYTFNLNKWKPNDHNILYITGLSGGGKSTTAKELCEKYNAHHIELDTFENAYQFINHPNSFYEYQNEKDILMIIEYYRQKPFKDPCEMNDEEYKRYFMNLFTFMLKKMKDDKSHLYVVEGIQVIRLARNGYDEEIFSSPLIIKNTSMLEAIIRRWKRDGNEALRVGGIAEEEVKLSPKTLSRFFRWYLDQEYSLNCFRKARKKGSVMNLDKYLIGLEATQYPFEDLASDAESIINSLTKKEKFYVGEGYWIRSPRVIYRKIDYEEGKPIALIDVYKFPKTGASGHILIAVSNKARGKGIASKLVSEAKRALTGDPRINRLGWLVDSDNTKSINLAKSLGFEYVRDENNGKEKLFELML